MISNLLDSEKLKKDSLESIRSLKSAKEISNEIALESPFGKRSLFYKAEFIDKNIDFVKLSEFIKKGTDAIFDYKDFIGRETRIVSHIISFGEEAKFDRMAGIPTKYDSKESYDAEIPLVKQSFAGERALQLKGKLYKEDSALVNIEKDYDGDATGGLEFEFDYKRKTVNYKIHFYYVGKALVYEKNNIDNISFTVSSSNYEDFYAFLKIIGRKYPNENFKNEIANSFVNAIKAIKERVDKKPQKQYDGIDFRDLEWLYQNIPYFAAKQLDFNATIEHVFRLNLADVKSPLLDFTAAITSILQKLDSQKVYDYFYANPQKLISLYNGFNEEKLIKPFCTYLTAITFLYGKQDIEKARNFALSDSTHIETNILYGDEKGKVALANELQLPTIGFNGLNFINLFSDDIEISNPKNQSNQFHPLDIIYISQYDENYQEVEKVPSIALYGKYLGDASEWSDVTDATLAVIDVISIIISGGVLVAGVKAARLFAIIDIAISTINLAVLNPDLRNRLNKTEAGRWFVSHWGIISFCVSLGTISYYLAKGIIKYNSQLKQQLKNEPELAKQIDELVDESKRVIEIDNLAKWDLSMGKPGGKGFLGGQKLSRQEIKLWISKIEEISNSKAILKIIDESSHTLKGGQAGFNPFTMEIFVKKGVTEYEIFHEYKHLEECIKIGKDEYLKGWKFIGGTPEQNIIRQYKREIYVYNEILKESKKFNKEQLKHAFEANIKPILKELEDTGIDVTKIIK